MISNMLLTLLLFLVVLETAHTKCPTGIKGTNASSYQGYGDNCYYFSTIPLSMPASHRRCKERGHGHIVYINSAEENEFLRKTLVNTYGLKNSLVWTGLILPGSEFEWYDSISPVTYTNLDPDTSLNVDPNDDMLCIVMDTTNGLWKSYRCFNPDFFNRNYPKLPYVCEFKGLNKKPDMRG